MFMGLRYCFTLAGRKCGLFFSIELWRKSEQMKCTSRDLKVVINAVADLPVVGAENVDICMVEMGM